MAKKPKSSLGVTFWIALLVFLSLLYAANRIDFSGLFGKSGVSGVVSRLFGGDYRSSPAGKESEKPIPGPENPPAAAPLKETPRETPPAPRKVPSEEPARQAPQKTAPAPAPTPAPETAPAAKTAPPPKTAAEPPPAKTPAPGPALLEPAARPAETAKTRDGVLYFVRLAGDGRVIPAPVTRKIPIGPGPMADALAALLAGPSPEEAKTGVQSFIPAGTLLQSATAKEGVASLSFNENLRFNSYGIEGFREQVKQIVYTATEFPTIKAVQILINGGKVDYLSPEGLYIGKPIGRESF